MTRHEPNSLLQAEATLITTGLDLQAQALSLLLAEMRALSEVLPGASPHLSRADAEIEGDFDNMPV
jgi:hypothetical protein